MSYSVKEIFYTLQGEGVHTGRAAVFCRFVGCNLWSGHEKDRANAICKFCDTDFIGTDGADGGKFDTEARWQTESNRPGKPASTQKEVCGIHRRRTAPATGSATDRCVACPGFRDCSGNEWNCCRPLGLDWICVSPKAGAKLVQNTGDELKLVFPQAGAKPEEFQGLAFRHFFLQPMDGPYRKANTDKALRYCLGNPLWRLSVQTHKFVGIR